MAGDSPDAEMAWFFLLVIVAIGLGIAGAVIEGFVFLLVIACIVFALDLIFLGTVIRGRRRTPSR
ncbi:MAG: hypothetical protein ACRDVP_07660 [Acidimicrobiales bacterium]